MKKSYITPSFTSIEMKVENAILTTSPGSMKYTQDEFVDETNVGTSILSTGSNSWESASSSSVWEEDEE